MTGPFIFLALCLVVAFAAVAPLLLQRRPEEGWTRWIAGSFDAFRNRDMVDKGQPLDTSLEQLFRESAGEDVPGYTTLDELRTSLTDTYTAVRH